ncbi:Afadin and alpha-actinin-binding-domain-containing protein [Microdochium trichocladiopsis]|uniref:Afadin and alpha-actinin-binding-domain-containing protein n=1 Tax=Microdochium trichocladiopsis TaxID=1682393 RepID=A0A9P8Y076_9PEZI|nr:Afadin and alpha-actinin-binding-domain-containing protein [Microdochium trichocladiopsis]KAH7026120.1 Afadin and alpha-actinin-binding-domain-containing protein [Microdochium trichocladiopsis]
MAEMDNLRTASLYINNQLLSRGLLRDGQSIDFANPGADPGGLAAAMGRIMSVVNDLILKRDRDAEHRESLSSTLRTLRAETLRQTTDYTRQADKLADAQRRLDSADSTERAMRTQLKTAEANIHKMKDEMHKMKTLVAQTRSSCANEVRKRDRQIEALKKTVTEAARVRGGARSRDVVTISVTGDFGAESSGAPAGATSEAEYSLRMETNEFLTRLARGLSEENEGLVNIVRQTVDSLREMGGLEASLGSSTSGKGAEELAAELEGIMDHLRNILTNPSFVPIEEVEMRDEEINRLRAGFEKMEMRWKDAVRMIDGWRRRMGSGGKSVDMEELSMGLRLSPVRIRDIVEGEPSRSEAMELSCVQEEEEEEEEEEVVKKHTPSRASPPRLQHVALARTRSPSPIEDVQQVEATDPEVDAMQYDEDGVEEDSDTSSIYEDDLLEVEEVEEPNFEVLQESTGPAVPSSPLPERPQLSPLKDSFSAGNKMLGEERPHFSRKRGAGDASAASEEPVNQTSKGPVEEDKKREKREPVPPSRNTRLAARRSLEKSAESFELAYESPHFGKSSEKASELRLFSKPAPPLTLQGKDKSKTAAPARPRTEKTEQPAAAPSFPRNARSRAAATSKKVTAATEKPEGPAEKKLRRSLPDSEPDEGGGARLQVLVPAAADKVELVAAPTGSDSSSSSSSKSNAVNLGPRPQALQQTCSPIRPQGSRLLPPRRRVPAIPQSPLTMEAITAKLAASEREADAARVRAKLKAARLGRRAGGTSPPGAAASPAKNKTAAVASSSSPPAVSAASQEEHEEPVKKTVKTTSSPIRIVEPDSGDDQEAHDAVRVQPVVEDGDLLDDLAAPESQEEVEQQHQQGSSPKIEVVKRKRDKRLNQATSRRASRRRSTLSPWELESLISGNVGPPSPTRG